MICKRCGKDVEPYSIIGPFGQNYGKQICPLCDCFFKWIKKPENEKKRTKGSKHTPESLGIEYCELCRRKRSQLGRYETLHIHHKDCTALANDVPENIIVVCSGCHSTIHHNITLTKTYLDPSKKMFADEACTEIDFNEAPF